MYLGSIVEKKSDTILHNIHPGPFDPYDHIPILDSFELCEHMIISALYACLLYKLYRISDDLLFWN